MKQVVEEVVKVVLEQHLLIKLLNKVWGACHKDESPAETHAFIEEVKAAAQPYKEEAKPEAGALADKKAADK